MNIKEFITGLIIFLLIVFGSLSMAKPVNAQEKQPELKEVWATAYYDAYGSGISYDGRKLVEGLTIAGRKQDVGKTAVIYTLDYNLVGIYEFRDIGFGSPTGKGQSGLLPRSSLGTIEAGETVDIYFKSYRDCLKWGKRRVLMQIVNAKG